jgi:hypothetical protein
MPIQKLIIKYILTISFFICFTANARTILGCEETTIGKLDFILRMPHLLQNFSEDEITEIYKKELECYGNFKGSELWLKNNAISYLKDNFKIKLKLVLQAQQEIANRIIAQKKLTNPYTILEIKDLIQSNYKFNYIKNYNSGRDFSQQTPPYSYNSDLLFDKKINFNYPLPFQYSSDRFDPRFEAFWGNNFACFGDVKKGYQITSMMMQFSFADQSEINNSLKEYATLYKFCDTKELNSYYLDLIKFSKEMNQYLIAKRVSDLKLISSYDLKINESKNAFHISEKINCLKRLNISENLGAKIILGFNNLSVCHYFMQDIFSKTNISFSKNNAVKGDAFTTVIKNNSSSASITFQLSDDDKHLIPKTYSTNTKKTPIKDMFDANKAAQDILNLFE